MKRILEIHSDVKVLDATKLYPWNDSKFYVRCRLPQFLKNNYLGQHARVRESRQQRSVHQTDSSLWKGPSIRQMTVSSECQEHSLPGWFLLDYVSLEDLQGLFRAHFCVHSCWSITSSEGCLGKPRLKGNSKRVHDALCQPPRHGLSLLAEDHRSWGREAGGGGDVTEQREMDEWTGTMKVLDPTETPGYQERCYHCCIEINFNVKATFGGLKE